MSSSHERLLKELRSRVATEEPLPGENFFQEDETLLRFLKAREWSVDAAEKQLRDAIAWRRSYRPLSIDCKWCHEQPGYHSMRQVGFDEAGRPVIYACFSQADASRNGVEDTVAHCTYLIENGRKTMRQGASTWFLVIDCTGLSLPQCNPNFASGVVSVFSNFYPEQMERIVCVNHSSLFHGVWNAIKVFVDPKTAKKMKFVRGKEKMQRKFREFFGDQMAAWLLEEIRLNKVEPLPEPQEKFWEAPLRPGQHDPRGCTDYVERYVDPYFVSLAQLGEAGVARPHPNVADQQTGRLADYVPRARRRSDKGKKQHKQQKQQVDQELAAYGVAPVAASESAKFDESSDDDEANNGDGAQASERRSNGGSK